MLLRFKSNNNCNYSLNISFCSGQIIVKTMASPRGQGQGQGPTSRLRPRPEPRTLNSLKVKVKARPLDAKAKDKDTKLCPQGSSRPRPGLEDYITGTYTQGVTSQNQVSSSSVIPDELRHGQINTPCIHRWLVLNKFSSSCLDLHLLYFVFCHQISPDSVISSCM
jgi:hypothetical protein